MSNEAQELIEQSRELITKEDYRGAATLLNNAPTNRSNWEAHEVDEVECLVEFLHGLTDEEMSMVQL